MQMSDGDCLFRLAARSFGGSHISIERDQRMTNKLRPLDLSHPAAEQFLHDADACVGNGFLGRAAGPEPGGGRMPMSEADGFPRQPSTLTTQ